MKYNRYHGLLLGVACVIISLLLLYCYFTNCDYTRLNNKQLLNIFGILLTVGSVIIIIYISDKISCLSKKNDENIILLEK